MACLDHWHPVLQSKALRNKPAAVRLCGKNIVLFRGEEGKIGALDDCCPHRRMRLSCGKVVDHKLQCTYHGWSYNTCGEGESPGTPKLHATATCYEACERLGVIWVKSAESRPAFPHFDVKGWWHLCTLQHKAKAPLELVVDNFCEIEHTPTTHAVFGYPLERMREVTVRFETTDTSVRVINAGPPKPLPTVYRLLLGVGRRYQFNDDWTTYFSPVYSVYDHWWSDPKSGRESWIRWRLFIFFTPIDDRETSITTLAFTKSIFPGPSGGVRFFRWLIKSNLDHEIDLDVNILENLADKNPHIEGMKLSRFDRVLGLNRERIERVYRGRQG
jgi:phenylpropionate dioxygenase-like ring-hydroxylating dioxygenase large terminal subunit